MIDFQISIHESFRKDLEEKILKKRRWMIDDSLETSINKLFQKHKTFQDIFIFKKEPIKNSVCRTGSFSEVEPFF
jgi:hypothetical protein